MTLPLTRYSPNYEDKALRLVRSCDRAGVCCKAVLLPSDAFGAGVTEDYLTQTLTQTLTLTLAPNLTLTVRLSLTLALTPTLTRCDGGLADVPLRDHSHEARLHQGAG